MRHSVRRLSLALGILMMSVGPALGQGFSTSITVPYRITPNITYLTANNFEAKLDIYARSDVTTPQPTLIWIHGGGWTGGNKEGATFSLLPYLEMGWNVVNVEYRLAKVSPAPAAVEDCLCALRWVIRNAKQLRVRHRQARRLRRIRRGTSRPDNGDDPGIGGFGPPVSGH